MKCIACGREMVERETHYECSNILCDYEEEIVTTQVWRRLKRDLQCIMVNIAVKSSSLNC
jgi:hypothetical protein